MKKAALVVFAVALMATAAYAETTKEAVGKMNEKAGNFWSKEGERSGLKESTSSWGKFWEKANPATFFKTQQDNYNARKTGSASGTVAGS